VARPCAGPGAGTRRRGPRAVPTIQSGVDANLAAFDAHLIQLDADIRSALSSLPNRAIITFHEAFGYFAERYGLTVPVTLVELPGDEPTVQDVARVGEEAESNGVTMLLVEPGPTPDLAHALADEFGLRLAVLDPLEAIDPATDAYENGMRRNLEVLLEALR
jgi:zinc transport system substrate-binding protein